VSWEKARDLGRAWVEQHLPTDLKGRLVQLAVFEQEEDCRHFHPHRSVNFHNMVVKAAGRNIRRLGGKTSHLQVTSADYFAWLADREDTIAQRKAFLDTIEIVIG
jgi:hypothetical protein